MRLQDNPLSHGIKAALCPLLSLQVVPARKRLIIRAQCNDRERPRDPPELIRTPSESGSGQLIARCPSCKVAVWSNYAGAGPIVSFVRVGTLDNPDLCPPDIHIFTQSKQPWVNLQGGAPAVAEYYDREEFWPPESLRRREALLPAIQAYQATLKPSAS